jgi:hypothetical protein
MGEGIHVESASRPRAVAASDSQYFPERTDPIGRNYDLFALLIVKILKRYSSMAHKQYLFVDSIAVYGKGSATTRDGIRTVRELGGAATMPLAPPDRSQVGPMDPRRRSRLVNPPSPRPTESIYSKWQSEALAG